MADKHTALSAILFFDDMVAANSYLLRISNEMAFFL